MPLVTIIIPVYNTEKYLRKCLDSVVNQTFASRSLEIIIINDASTDYSSEIINQYASMYKNIKVITKTHNEGLSCARNIGMKYAQGEYIFFLDSDDWIAEETIEKLFYLAESYNCQLVEASNKIVYRQNIKAVTNKPPKIKQIDIEKNKEYLFSKSGSACNKLYAHSLIKNERFPEGVIFEDAAFIYPILTKAKETICTNEVLYFYYRHKNSTTLQNKIKPNERIFDIYTICELIKNRCIKLGTFDDFHAILEDVIKSKYLYILLEINGWMQLGIKNHMLLLNYLKQYTEETYEYNSLFTTSMVKNRLEKDFLYRARITQLKNHLELANALYPTISYEPLEDAKRIIAKYKR